MDDKLQEAIRLLEANGYKVTRASLVKDARDKALRYLDDAIALLNASAAQKKAGDLNYRHSESLGMMQHTNFIISSNPLWMMGFWDQEEIDHVRSKGGRSGQEGAG